MGSTKFLATGILSTSFTHMTLHMKPAKLTISPLLCLALVVAGLSQGEEKQLDIRSDSKTVTSNSKGSTQPTNSTPSSNLLDGLGIIQENQILSIKAAFAQASSACRRQQIAKYFGRAVKDSERIPLRIDEALEIPALSEQEIAETISQLEKELSKYVNQKQSTALLKGAKDYLEETDTNSYSIAAVSLVKIASEPNDKENIGIRGAALAPKLNYNSYRIWINKSKSEKPEQIGNILPGD